MPPLENLLEFLDETYPAKTEGMGLPYGENFIINFNRCSIIHPSDRQTAGRTGDSISALSIAICHRALIKCIDYNLVYYLPL